MQIYDMLIEMDMFLMFDEFGQNILINITILSIYR